MRGSRYAGWLQCFIVGNVVSWRRQLGMMCPETDTAVNWKM